MAGPYRIRPGSSADAEGLAALERVTFSDAWPAAAFLAPGPGECLFVALDPEEGLAGFVVSRAAADEGEILDLAVRAADRRQGLGGRLLATALEALAAAGCRRVHLEVRVSNQPARAFYARHGFLAAGRRAGYYRKPPEDALLMQRDVSPITPGA